jgi:hypothetical protein
MNTALEFKHVQGKRILKRLKSQHEFLDIETQPVCNDIRCGWASYYKRLLRVPWFPCRHTVGFREVEWPKPENTSIECPGDSGVEVKEYNGTWRI